MTGGEELRERRRRAGLLGTEATAWDVAWPAVFLASDEARWITAATLPVDAGTTSATAVWCCTLERMVSGMTRGSTTSGVPEPLGRWSGVSAERLGHRDLLGQVRLGTGFPGCTPQGSTQAHTGSPRSSGSSIGAAGAGLHRRLTHPRARRGLTG